MPYSFCESEVAGSASRWHVRKLTSAGKKCSGGIDTSSLCGRIYRGWDLETELKEWPLDKLKTVLCARCFELYAAIRRGEGDDAADAEGDKAGGRG